MGSQDANVSRTMFSEDKRYRKAIAQQNVEVIDADLNDASDSILNYFRRIVQTSLGDGFVNHAFKIKEADGLGHRSADPENNFVVTGGIPEGGTEGQDISDGGDAGAYMIDGIRTVLFGDVNYQSAHPFNVPTGVNVESQKSIYPRVTSVTYNAGASETTIHDTAQKYAVDFDTTDRKLTILNGEVGVTDLAILSQTETSITVAGDLTSKISQYDRYTVTLVAPATGTRIDKVYLNVYLDQINAAEDPNLYHALETSKECFIREQVIQEIYVQQGDSNELENYVDADGNKHYVVKLAEIDRTTDSDITNTMIRSNYIHEFIISSISSLFNIVGSAGYANHSTPGDNMPVDGAGWPVAPGTLPLNAVYIARSEDDDSPVNPAGFYNIVSGDWAYMFNIEIEDANDILYKNKSTGADKYMTSNGTVDEKLSELSVGIDASQKWTVSTVAEFDVAAAAISSGEHKITLMPGIYNKTYDALVQYDFGSANVVIEGFGKYVTSFIIDGDSTPDRTLFISTGLVIIRDITISAEFYGSNGYFVKGYKLIIMNSALSDNGTSTLDSTSMGSIIESEIYLGNVTLGEHSTIKNSIVTGTIVQGIFGILTDSTLGGLLNLGDHSYVNNCELYGTTITQGDYSYCNISGDMASITQGDNSELHISNRIDQYIGKIVQGGYSTISGHGAISLGIEEGGPIPIIQGYKCKIVDVDIVISLRESLTTSTTAYTLINQGSSGEVLNSNLLFDANGYDISGSDITVGLLNQSVASLVRDFIVATVLGGSTIGSGCEFTFTNLHKVFNLKYSYSGTVMPCRVILTGIYCCFDNCYLEGDVDLPSYSEATIANSNITGTLTDPSGAGSPCGIMISNSDIHTVLLSGFLVTLSGCIITNLTVSQQTHMSGCSVGSIVAVVPGYTGWCVIVGNTYKTIGPIGSPQVIANNLDV